MLDEVKKKIILDLIVNPITLTPLVLGGMALLGSWANEGPAMLSMAGFASMVLGIGILSTKIIFGLDKVAKRVYDQISEEKKNDAENKLNALSQKLSSFKDARPFNSLNDARSFYNQFNDGVNSGEIPASTSSILKENIDNLFHACVNNLNKLCELNSKIKASNSKKAKSLLLNKGNEIIESVEESTLKLGEIVKKCSEDLSGDNKLSELTKQLEENMEVARRTDESMKEFKKGIYKSSVLE